jgi:hypothetical protein
MAAIYRLHACAAAQPRVLSCPALRRVHPAGWPVLAGGVFFLARRRGQETTLGPVGAAIKGFRTFT